MSAGCRTHPTQQQTPVHQTVSLEQDTRLGGEAVGLFGNGKCALCGQHELNISHLDR